MTDPTPESPSGPYAQAAGIYWAAGWAPLPLPAHSKKPVPRGWTGHDGAWPSYPDVQSWIDGGESVGNVALRLPRHVIGIDVDNYDEKHGGETLERAVEKWGELPATWRSSSRDDGVSGISLFTVPEGLAWPGELGPATELIQFGHRYVVAWPSVHPEGGTYRWYSPDGAVVINQVPQVDELPALPDEWVAGLTGGALREDVARADYTALETASWLATHGQGDTCRSMRLAIERYVNELADRGLSRHGVALNATARIARMIGEGHLGGLDALAKVRAGFDAAVDRTPERERDPKEWARLIDGAIQLAAAIPASDRDPCTDPFAALLNRGSSSQPSKAPSAATMLDAGSAATSSSGTSPSAQFLDAGASTPAQLLLAQEIERQRAQRGARRHLDDEEAASSFREPIWVHTLTAELELPDNPISFTVADVLPAGGNVLLTAQFKAGKTTLVNNLARSLVDSEAFLDRYEVAGEHRVGIFNYEVGRDQFRRWLRDETIGNTDRVTVLNLRGYRMPLVNPRIEDWVVKWLLEHEITTWVLDPFARAFVGSGDNENDNSQVGRFLDALDVIKERAGVKELIMPTHTGRAVQEVGAERARGATRLDDWADVRWLLTIDDDGNRFFRASGRDVNTPEGGLSFEPLTRRLSINDGGRRKNSSPMGLAAALLAVIRSTPGIGNRGIQDALRAAGIKARTDSIGVELVSLMTANRIRREGDKALGYHFHEQTERDLIIVKDASELFPKVFPKGVSGVSHSVPGGVSTAPLKGAGNNPFPETPEDEKQSLPPMTREQREIQGAALREAINRGARPQIDFAGNVVDTITGELIWSAS